MKKLRSRRVAPQRAVPRRPLVRPVEVRPPARARGGRRLGPPVIADRDRRGMIEIEAIEAIETEATETEATEETVAIGRSVHRAHR